MAPQLWEVSGNIGVELKSISEWRCRSEQVIQRLSLSPTHEHCNPNLINRERGEEPQTWTQFITRPALRHTHTSLQSYTERKLFSNIVPRWQRRFEQSRIIYDRLRDLQVWSDLTKILRLLKPEIMGRNQDFLTILSLNTYFLCQEIFIKKNIWSQKYL